MNVLNIDVNLDKTEIYKCCKIEFWTSIDIVDAVSDSPIKGIKIKYDKTNNSNLNNDNKIVLEKLDNKNYILLNGYDIVQVLCNELNFLSNFEEMTSENIDIANRLNELYIYEKKQQVLDIDTNKFLDTKLNLNKQNNEVIIRVASDKLVIDKKYEDIVDKELDKMIAELEQEIEKDSNDYIKMKELEEIELATKYKFKKYKCGDLFTCHTWSIYEQSYNKYPLHGTILFPLTYPNQVYEYDVRKIDDVKPYHHDCCHYISMSILEKDILEEDYLLLYLKKHIFRLCTQENICVNTYYNDQGGKISELFNNIDISLPSIKVQRKIVNEYNKLKLQNEYIKKRTDEYVKNKIGENDIKIENLSIDF
jgi:hypothetical protein